MRVRDVPPVRSGSAQNQCEVSDKSLEIFDVVEKSLGYFQSIVTYRSLSQSLNSYLAILLS